MSRATQAVDVVIAAHNEETMIAQCLASLLDQDYPRSRYRIIVVDSGSTDATAQIARGYGVDVVPASKAGAANARNLGIGAGNGELVGFLDAHCVAGREWISAMAREFNDPRIGGCQGHTTLAATDERVVHHIEASGMGDHDHLLDATLRGELNILPWMLSGNCMYRRSVVAEVNGFDESLPSCEDVDTSWRVVLAGYLLSYARDAKVIHWNCDSWDTYVQKSYQQGRGAAVLAKRYLPLGARNVFEPVPMEKDGNASRVARRYEEGYRTEEASIEERTLCLPRSTRREEILKWTINDPLAVSPGAVYWFRDDATSVIVHNPSRSRVILDGTANIIWRHLTEGKSRDEVANDLSRLFSIPAEKAAADADDLIEDLIENGILIRDRD